MSYFSLIAATPILPREEDLQALTAQCPYELDWWQIGGAFHGKLTDDDGIGHNQLLKAHCDDSSLTAFAFAKPGHYVEKGAVSFGSPVNADWPAVFLQEIEAVPRSWFLTVIHCHF